MNERVPLRSERAGRVTELLLSFDSATDPPASTVTTRSQGVGLLLLILRHEVGIVTLIGTVLPAAMPGVTVSRNRRLSAHEDRKSRGPATCPPRSRLDSERSAATCPGTQIDRSQLPHRESDLAAVVPTLPTLG